VPRSHHTGGVNVVMGDGVVRRVLDGIDLKVWQALNTRSSGERLVAEELPLPAQPMNQ